MNKTPFTIIQYNTHRSRDVVMADFLAKPKVIQADIIAVQEPWENPYNDTTYHPLKQTHELLFPSSSETGSRARVCMYVSKRIGTEWTHYAHSAFCQEVRIQSPTLGTLRILNIYNECGTTDTVELLHELLNPRDQIMLLGDFNLHHPAWGGIDSTQDPGSDKLIELCDIANLDLWLEPGTITRDQNGRQTTIDLSFGSPTLTDRLVVCELALDCHADSDHLPIRTILDINTPEAIQPKRRLWKAMDTDKFDKFVAENLGNLSRWHLESPRQIDNAVDHLMDIVQRGVQESTPWANPSPRANPSWTKECGEAVLDARQAFRKYIATHYDNDWQVYKMARNQKGRIIKRALRHGFRSFIEDAVAQGPQGLWKVSKWARNRGQQQGTTMPALKTHNDAMAETNESKVNTLRSVFFPEPPEADLSDIQNHRPAKQIPLPAITAQEVEAAFRKAPPDKAPGNDTIPNKVWKILANQGSKSYTRFIPVVTGIFNACVEHGHNPAHFQTSITVTLRKAGPRDYRIPKSYRPVALLNTLGKILESIIATRIAWAVEEFKLLPDTHLGGRRGISVDHAIQLILDRVHRAWGDGKVASMLLLDVAGAYDNVSHERLISNMNNLGLGGITAWIQSFLTDRHTRIKLPNGYISDAFSTPTGIPQGSPLSPILFLLFNAPLVKSCTQHLRYGRSEAFGWVDDVCILAMSNSYEENVWILEAALQKADKWAWKHAAKFAPDKFELIHFTNPKGTKNHPQDYPQDRSQNQNEQTNTQTNIWEIPDDPSGHEGMPVTVPGHPPIQPSETAKYLGVWLDKRLDFSTHRKKMLAKGASSLEALRGISGSTWGSSLIAMRKVYQAVIIPQMLWGVSAWYCPAARAMPRGDLERLTNELTKIQKRAAILISGAFRGTAGAALDTELYLLPIKLRLHQTAEETAIRILTGPRWACPKTAKEARKPAQRRLGGWAPTEAITWKTLRLQKNEKWEEKRAFVLAPWEARIPCIIESQEIALKTHDVSNERAACDKDVTMLFTDGSGFAGHIGASSVSLRNGISSQRRYLGTDSQSTVYAAELSGIEMALATARNDNKETVIFSDSQAAIQAVQNPQRPSGQYVLAVIYDHVRAIRSSKTNNITIRWIPAHVGVDGNEFADEEAKSAALLGAGMEVATGTGEPIIRLAAAAKSAVRQRIRERWNKQWERESTSGPTKRLVQAPNKKTLRLYEGLSKPQCAILIQMRTMRIGLRHFLFKIKAADTDKCSCGEGSQTPKHVLLQCPLYTDLRRQFWMRLDKDEVEVETDYDKIMQHPQATRYVAKFMQQTGLLQQFRCVELEDDDEPIGLAAMEPGVEDDGY